MIQIKTFKDLLTRPLLEALIEKKRLASGEERPVFKNRGLGEQRPTDDDEYVFDIPSRSISRTEEKRGLLDLAADEQDAQYILAQMVLSNLGLIPKIYRSRHINVNPSNANKINKIKNLLANLFAKSKLDPNAPAYVLKNLLNYPKSQIDSTVGFNTFDLLHKKKDWNEVLTTLPKKIANYIAGLDNRAELNHKISDNFYQRLGTDAAEADAPPSNAAALAAQMYGEAVEDSDLEYEDKGPLSMEQKEQMYSTAYRTLHPLYSTAAKSGLSPMQYLAFQQEIDKVSGALKTNNILYNLKALENDKQPVTVSDYEDILIEALAKSIKGDGEKQQVSNLVAKQATLALRWLTRHLSALGYKGGFKIENIFDYIKNGTDEHAKDARYYLKTIYNISPEDLNNENFPTFKKFVDYLYKGDKNILQAYRNIKPNIVPQRLSLAKTHDKAGNPIPLVRDRIGGVGQAKSAIKKSLDIAQARYDNWKAKPGKLAEWEEMDRAWKTGELAKHLYVSAALFKVNGNYLGGKDEPLIDFGEVTLPELKKKTAEGISTGWIDLVPDKFKSVYKNFITENPDVVEKIRKHIVQQKNVWTNKIGNQIRFSIKSADEKYKKDIEKLQKEYEAVTGTKLDNNLEPKDLSDFSDESPDGVNDDPYIVFSIDETAPRLINPIIKTLQTQLATFNITVEWSTNMDDEEGYITLYYPEDGKIYKAKNPKKLVADLRGSIQQLADKLGYKYVSIKPYAYEFENEQYDSSGFSAPEDEEEINFADDDDAAQIESEFDSEDEERPIKEHKITFVQNRTKYPRAYLQDRYREYYISNN